MLRFIRRAAVVAVLAVIASISTHSSFAAVQTDSTMSIAPNARGGDTVQSLPGLTPSPSFVVSNTPAPAKEQVQFTNLLLAAGGDPATALLVPVNVAGNGTTTEQSSGARVPEPASLTLFGGVCMGLVTLARVKRRN